MHYRNIEKKNKIPPKQVLMILNSYNKITLEKK